MAFTAYKYDHARRTRYFRVNKAQVPMSLPFDLIDIDGEQYYEPHSINRYVDEMGQTQRGEYAGVVYVDSNRPLPRTAGNLPQDQYAVWSYYGI